LRAGARGQTADHLSERLGGGETKFGTAGQISKRRAKGGVPASGATTKPSDPY